MVVKKININIENYIRKEYIEVFKSYSEINSIDDVWATLANLAKLECLVDDWETKLDTLLFSQIKVNFKVETAEEASNLSSSEEYSVEQNDGSAHLTMVAGDRTSKTLAMKMYEGVSKIYYVLNYNRKDFNYNIPLLIDIVLSDAKRLNSTDVHFIIESDLEENFNYCVKFRQGIYLYTQEKYKLSKEIFEDVISELLINRSSVGQKLAELDIRTGLRFRLVDSRFPARCQVAKSIGGRTLTTRLFDFKKAPTIAQLGFNKETQEMLVKTSKTYAGLTLVSGVFGSGKGTTLNSVGMLMEETGKLAIASLDDPIEYLRKYNQYEYSSESQLRELVDAFKKMDLNVVFLNEIITNHTAKAVYNLVSAGVHVLSTIHTERVFKVMYKLQELLGDEYLNLIPFLNVISYQDKFSVCCDNCVRGVSKDFYHESSDEYKLLTYFNLDIIHQPKGCSKCHDGILRTGIKVVSEHIEFNDKIKMDLIRLDVHKQYEYLKELNKEGESLEKVLKQSLIDGTVLISEIVLKLDTWR